MDHGLEHKFCRTDGPLAVEEGAILEGYASLFEQRDGGGDVVARGAYATSLERLGAAGLRVKMLWQHDPARPIGVWETVAEDERGLRVRGRLLTETQQGREAAALVGAGAIDGLSIGYRTVRATRGEGGTRRLEQIDLWEISLVTFPMLAGARVGAMGEEPQTPDQAALAAAFREAGRLLGI